MRQLPEKVQQELRPNLTVVWWGRRSSFEIVEEVSEGIFRNIMIWCGFIMVSQIFSETPLFQIAAVFIGLSLFASAKMFNEILSWINEVHIVAADETNGNGRVYKFFGWLNYRHIEEAITPNSPTKLVERPLFFRLWGWATGQRMERVQLYSQNHTFLEGKKMPYAYSRAINTVGGYKPAKPGDTPQELAILPIIQQLRAAGIIKQDLAQPAAEAIVRRIAFSDGVSYD